MKRGDELHLKIEDSAFEGKSLARLDGMVVFVPGGVPGDEVRVRVVRTKKNYSEAELLDVLAPSPLRVEPRCRYFGTCGGCMWQHVSYQAQLDFKRQHVVDALERIGGFKDITVRPTLGADSAYFYRNKMEFSFGEKWLTKEELEAKRQKQESRESSPLFALGLHIPRRFDRVLDVEECHLQSETSYGIVNFVRSFCIARKLSIYSTFTHTGYLRNLVLREGKRTGELMVNLVTSEDQRDTMKALSDELLAHFPSVTTFVNNITTRKSQVAIGESERVYHGPGFITDRIGNKVFRISANSFFQTNTLQAERLYETAKAMARLRRDDVVFDLYSGTGTIALFIADDVAEVVGIEAVESAIADARRNAAVNNVQNCSFYLGDLKERLTRDADWQQRHRLPTVIITDPPRTGMHEKVIAQVLALSPERIVYVSCNPATQARDLKLLCGTGKYGVSGVQPVDMFPHTYHIENVVGLSLQG